MGSAIDEPCYFVLSVRPGSCGSVSVRGLSIWDSVGVNTDAHGAELVVPHARISHSLRACVASHSVSPPVGVVPTLTAA